MRQPLVAQDLEHRGPEQLAKAHVEPLLAEVCAERQLAQGRRLVHVGKQPASGLVHCVALARRQLALLAPTTLLLSGSGL